MSKNHLYEYHVSPNSAAEKVVCMVGKNKRVLELGSGPGSITREISANDCRVTVLEIDLSALEIVKSYCENAYQCDLNNKDWRTTIPAIGNFDTIVAADVFEHLHDPWHCMSQLHTLLADNGSLVVSLPHAGHAAIMACLYNSDFDYQSYGLLDKTHFRFFGLNNMQKLFEEAGFKVVDADFIVKHPKQTELRHQWAGVPEESRHAFLSGEFSHVYQVVIKAVPLESSGQAIDLTSSSIPNLEKLSITNHMRNTKIGGYLASFIKPETRGKITVFFRKFGL